MVLVERFMQLVFVPPNLRQLKASSLMLLHSGATILATIAVYQLAATSTAQAQGALPVLDAAPSVDFRTAAQTPVPPQRRQKAVSRRPTATELIEQARQNLRDRGELPPATAPVTAPAAKPQLPTNLPPSQSLPLLGAPDALPLPPIVQPFEAYRLGPRDTVAIVVQRFADFNAQAVIDPEGNITHPIIGKVPLRGLTIEQAQERIRQQVDRFIINPVVLVSLTNQRPVQVTIVGEIAKPGLYPLSQAPQLSAALLVGGGSREDADLRAVMVRRLMPDGSVKEEAFNLFNALKQGTALPNPNLQDGDTIFIPKLKLGEPDYDRTIASRSTLVRPQITVRVLSYASGGLRQLPLANGSTFLDALATAGVNPDQVDMKKIALVRFDEQQKKALSVTIDGKKALMGDLSQNIALRDNDVIIIGRNLVGRITQTLNTFTQPFRDVLGFLLFFRQLGDNANNLFGPNR
jgi:polysaccharide biosynthesis/export protein